ncbi:unnamed protein product [Parnassius apollo]|uniref:(apollo) hypothetical protein n=1 Tax=Parnassius apollo TaxID=110799 RepID=A0A8S3WEE0_PARAO|nr:unnamed protein product [Parnassius apollo]
MKNDSGKWNHRRTGILDVATSYYKRLYESNTTEDEIDLADTSNIPNILQAEVKKAIYTQNVDKTPGPDGISNEILRQGKEVLAPVLTDMFNNIINTEIIPQQWTLSCCIRRDINMKSETIATSVLCQTSTKSSLRSF